MKTFAEMTEKERVVVNHVRWMLKKSNAVFSRDGIRGDSVDLSFDNILSAIDELCIRTDENSGVPAELKSERAGYERKERYSLESVFKHIGKDVVFFDGDPIKMESARLSLFRNNKVCVKCGLVGQYFVKEKRAVEMRCNLNLYGIRDGKEVLMTKDHILAQSLGGSNNRENLQTMCTDCNFEKSLIENKQRILSRAMTWKKSLRRR